MEVVAQVVSLSHGQLMVVGLALAWAGALAWPLVLAASAWAWSRRRRHGAGRRSMSGVLAAGAAGSAIAVTLVWAIGVWAVLIEPQLLVVREVRVESAAWRGPPVRVGVIADVHAGNPHMTPQRVEKIARRMTALRPDVVLLAGDYVAGSLSPRERSAEENAAIARGLAALAGVAAPLGTIAVLGNHDWWYDGESVERALAAAGVRVLENAAIAVGEGKGRFWIAGLADYESARAEPDWDAALAAAPPDAPVIALAHWPDVFWEAPARVGLTVAGHSHCGQLNLPILGRIPVSPGAARWPCGLYNEDGRFLFVSGGVGVSVLPVRFRAPPEIVMLTLSGEAS